VTVRRERPFDKPAGFYTIRKMVEWSEIDNTFRSEMIRLVENSVTYGEWLAKQIGPNVAMAYLEEEDYENRKIRPRWIFRMGVYVPNFTVPEGLWLATMEKYEPWHGGFGVIRLSLAEYMAQEAAEGGSNIECAYHPSLRKNGFTSDPNVLAYFDAEGREKEREIGRRIQDRVRSKCESV